MRKKVNTVVVSTDVVILPDQLKRKCLRSTHHWRDIIIFLMKKCSLAYKKLKHFYLTECVLNIELYVYLQVVGTANSVHNNVERV